MEYHLTGSESDLPLDITMRASDGVISGRSATRRSPLSWKLYSCCVTSSPALRTYSSSLSSTGASYSSNPYSRATCNTQSCSVSKENPIPSAAKVDRVKSSSLGR